jgi:hypothetical protein
MEVSKHHGPQQGAALRKRSTKYVGLDVHQATTVASVREDGGRVIAHAVVPTEAAALFELFRGMRGAIHVALEQGTQAQWLHQLLTPRVDRWWCAIGGANRARGTRGTSATRTSSPSACARAGCARCTTGATGTRR